MKKRRCRHCGDREFIEVNRGLCKRCFGNPRIRPKYQLLRFKASPLPKKRCKFPPGSEGKILCVANRFARKQNLFHPQDATGENAKVGEVQPIQERTYHSPGETGIETLPNGKFRVRPFWNGKLEHIASYDTEKEALDRVREYWKEKLGLFWQHRQTVGNWTLEKESYHCKRVKKKRKQMNSLWGEQCE